jgi:hypothetical protein
MLSGNYNPAMDGRQGEQLLYGIQTVEPEQVDISPSNYNKHAEVTQIKKTPEEPDQNQPSSRPSNPAHQIRPTEEEDSDLGLDWDKTHQSRFVKWVFQQKKDQRAERGRLDIYWRCWKQERHLLEERKKELSEAEVDLANRIYQIKPLLPVAQSLKELGFDFKLANSWITCVSQMVQSKGIGMREAAWKVAEEIQNLEYLGGINKAIDQQKHQLELLEMAIEDKKEAFAALADLKKQNIGVREILEVMETIKKNSSRSEPDSSQQEEDSN